MCKLIFRVLCLIIAGYLVIGCDQKNETTERTTTGSSRNRLTTSTSTTRQTYRQSSQDDSLYLQTLENLHKENGELKQQVADAVKMFLDMEEELKQIRTERDEAVNQANQIEGSIATLRSDALTKDQRIRQLEQTNREMQSTITSLTQQVNQLLSELNAAGTTSTPGPSDSGDRP